MISPTSVNGVPVRMFYIDDSGDPNSGWIVYSWIEVAILDWRHGLRAWLDLRKSMFTRHKIPPSYELHATKFLNGRGTPSTDPTFNMSKADRAAVVTEALQIIGATSQLRVGTFYRQTPTRGKAYYQERGHVYAELVNRLDDRLCGADEHGMIFMDGDGRDGSYYTAHRSLKLAERILIEDPLFQHSHRSQWVQMADMTAYCAYQSLIQIPQKRHTWYWYPQLLGPIDLHGGPVRV